MLGWPALFSFFVSFGNGAEGATELFDQRVPERTRLPMASPIARAAARTASHPCTVVVGSGVAGVASALHLARAGHENIYIVDDNAPMSMTSSLSTECYRDYWPEANMLGLMGRSIDLVDALAASSDNSFGMTRRGYLYLADNAADMESLTTGAWGTGMAVRTHRSAAEVEALPPMLSRSSRPASARAISERSRASILSLLGIGSRESRVAR